MPVRSPLTQRKLQQYSRLIEPLRKGLDLIDDHVIITDPDGVILYANPAAGRATGFSTAEMIGKNPGDLWGGYMSHNEYRQMWETIKTKKQPIRMEMKNRRKDGVDIWQELRISPVLDAENSIQFFIGVESVITHRKREAEFKDELLSVMSHDSLTPLTVIRWTLELLMEQSTFTGKQRESLEEILHQNKYLFSMIEDMIYVSRMGRGHPPAETFDVGVALEHVLHQLEEQYRSVGFVLEKDLGTLPIKTVQSLAVELFAMLIGTIMENIDKSEKRVHVSLKKDERDALTFSAAARAGGKAFRCSQKSLIEQTIKYLHWTMPVCGKKGNTVSCSLTIPTGPALSAS